MRTLWIDPPLTTPTDVFKDMQDVLSTADGDSEAAHSMEDQVALGIIKAVAAGNPNARAMAEMFVEMRDPEMVRWCA